MRRLAPNGSELSGRCGIDGWDRWDPWRRVLPLLGRLQWWSSLVVLVILDGRRKRLLSRRLAVHQLFRFLAAAETHHIPDAGSKSEGHEYQHQPGRGSEITVKHPAQAHGDRDP